MNKQILIVGNPNSGKSSLFNSLTGVQQKVGNYAGVTVEKRIGQCKLPEIGTVDITDLPGTYSMFSQSKDEEVVQKLLLSKTLQADLLLYVADASNLERHLLLFSQIMELNLPCALIINKIDIAIKKNTVIDAPKLAASLGVRVLCYSTKEGEQFEVLQQFITKELMQASTPLKKLHTYSPEELAMLANVPPNKEYIDNNFCKIWQLVKPDAFYNAAELNEVLRAFNLKPLNVEYTDIMSRYETITPLINGVIKNQEDKTLNKKTRQLDNVLTHKVLGPILFLAFMYLVFQSVFWLASYPMDFTESVFSNFGDWIKDSFGESLFTRLLADGLVAGIAGVMVFVPQLIIFFFFISILEETGYMSRVAFMFDGLFQRFGLNGRSIVGLITSGACAIPGIMSARTITNSKERLLTIFIAPLIPCSARLPVYAIMITFVEPDVSKQGFYLLLLYLLGILTALLVAFIGQYFIKSTEQSSLLLELPKYERPNWKNMYFSIQVKVQSFVINAGKIIVIIAMVLWALGTFGFPSNMEKAELAAIEYAKANSLDTIETQSTIATYQLEASFLGQMGKTMEPLIRPLGFDWKIGIALISSFAAREVFVGTMSTLYNISDPENTEGLRIQMSKSTFTGTQTPIYSSKTAWALLLFYAFAMQCMSTFAIVKRETNGWTVPIIQFVFMGLLAYLSAFLVASL
jgi:ferrous iron transport protein B